MDFFFFLPMCLYEFPVWKSTIQRCSGRCTSVKTTLNQFYQPSNNFILKLCFSFLCALRWPNFWTRRNVVCRWAMAFRRNLFSLLWRYSSMEQVLRKASSHPPIYTASQFINHSLRLRRGTHIFQKPRSHSKFRVTGGKDEAICILTTHKC